VLGTLRVSTPAISLSIAVEKLMEVMEVMEVEGAA
jgi:hypothetical protein